MKIATGQFCHCGCNIHIESMKELPDIGVGWGEFKKDGGKIRFALRATCDTCGSVFDPDHSRFVAYYNEASDHLY